MKRLVIGMTAHVDSGKTTLSEAMLYRSGEIRRLGRVDHGDAFLDTHSIERSRGITVFSKQAVLNRLKMLGNTLEQVFTVDFPKRNIHGDAKISNMIPGDPCMVIDLDTAMKGYAAVDYGDLIRSSCTGSRLDLTAVRDITQGFADGLSGCLNDDEIYSLYYGVLYVTGELSVRYLTDYLREDKYFKGKTSADCLKRANELLEQLSMFISAGDEITDVIYKSFKKQ